MTQSPAQMQIALLQRAVAGDPAAARNVSRDFGGRAFAQAFRMLGNRADAEDIAQEALLRLWRMAPDWQGDGARPTTWLYRVVANLCIDRMRRPAPISLQADDALDPPDPAPGADARLQRSARQQAVHAGLAQLPERQRQTMVLRHIEGHANPEIAKMLGISVDAVESLIARGKRRLAVDLGTKREELGFENDET